MMIIRSSKKIEKFFVTSRIKKLKTGKYRVVSEKGKHMGDFSTRKQALKRLKQIEYFKHNGSDDSFKEELEAGKKVEMEHADTLTKLIREAAPDLDDAEILRIVEQGAELIAKDHITEMSDYYSKLKVMEGESEGEAKESAKADKTSDKTQPVREDNFNLFNTDMVDKVPTDIFKNGYDTVKPPESGDDVSNLFSNNKQESSF